MLLKRRCIFIFLALKPRYKFLKVSLTQGKCRPVLVLICKQIMQRSSSTTRASDEFLVNFSPPSVVSLPMKSATADELPLYESNFDAHKKELGVNKSSVENVIHMIPLILIVCGFILWIFSHPGNI